MRCIGDIIVEIELVPADARAALYKAFMDEFFGILYRQAFALRSRDKKAG